MVTSGNSTRDKLIETAKELFLKKGVDRVGVREIAAQAGINLSLMNYYFRSKEILFETIFDILSKEKATVLREILNSDQPLKNKLKDYVFKYIDILSSDPILVSFVLSIIHRNPEKISKMKSVVYLYNTDIFCAQLNREADAGKIKRIDPEHFYISMISLILFPFAIKPLIADRNKFDNSGIEKFISERKQYVFEMLMAAITI